MFGGPAPQCVTDDQCPTYSPDIGTKSRTFCCSDVIAFYNYWCTGVNQTMLNAVATMCAPPPNCVPMNLSFLTKPVDSCYVGSNGTGGSVVRGWG